MLEVDTLLAFGVYAHTLFACMHISYMFMYVHLEVSIFFRTKMIESD